MRVVPLYGHSRRQRHHLPRPATTDLYRRGDDMTIHDAALDVATDTFSELPIPDLEAVKRRQQAMWASGDYQMIATQIQVVAELLMESLELHATERVLDVATGSGNAAIAAARRGTEVVGVDYVPALLDRARIRAEAEGLEASFVEGDAEALPFANGSFDVVSSVFGVMFAPNQERTAAELVRVTRPGGRIGLVSHTPEGFIGQVFRINGRHVPPPAGVRSPVQWGTEVRLRELFGGAIGSLTVQKRQYVFRYRSPEAYLDYWKRFYGPTLKAFEGVGAIGAPALERDLLELIGQFNRATDGTMVVPTEYLEAVIVTR
jgi:SAM-dependent methyltransferase